METFHPLPDAPPRISLDRDVVEAAVATLEEVLEQSKQHGTGPVLFPEMLLAEFRAALSAPPEQPQPGQWLPIESAPRDGTMLLLCVAGYRPALGSFYDGRWVSLDIVAAFEEDEDREEYLSATRYDPTYWQPLPAPPPAQ